MDIEAVKREIVARLKPLAPAEVILFGSYAYGRPREESDIDLYIVTNDDRMPESFAEKIKLKLAVTSRLKALKQQYDLDIIVHTRPMHEKFVKLGSLFAGEILTKGVRLL
jgi:predicted nucleotidyltransferase